MYGARVNYCVSTMESNSNLNQHVALQERLCSTKPGHPVLANAVGMSLKSYYYPKYLENGTENYKKTPQESAQVATCNQSMLTQKSPQPYSSQTIQASSAQTTETFQAKLHRIIKKGTPTFQLVDEGCMKLANKNLFPQEEGNCPVSRTAKQDVSLEAHQDMGEWRRVMLHGTMQLSLAWISLSATTNKSSSFPEFDLSKKKRNFGDQFNLVRRDQNLHESNNWDTLLNLKMNIRESDHESSSTSDFRTKEKFEKKPLLLKLKKIKGEECHQESESEKSPKGEISESKGEQGEEKQDSTYSHQVTSDKVALEEFDLKSCSLQTHGNRTMTDNTEILPTTTKDVDDEGPSFALDQTGIGHAKEKKTEFVASGSARSLLRKMMTKVQRNHGRLMASLLSQTNIQLCPSTGWQITDTRDAVVDLRIPD
ncbi:hypothetical protein Tco_0065538 [Tanacetum coccineum]